MMVKKIETDKEKNNFLLNMARIHFGLETWDVVVKRQQEEERKARLNAFFD